MNQAYYLAINARGEIEIRSAGKINVIGLAHRIPNPDSELPKFAADGLRKLGANPADYCWCNGRPVRNTHRAELERIITEARAAFALTPAGLREKRDSIIHKITANDSAAAEVRTKSFHQFDTGAGMGRNQYDANAELARAELSAFDAAHPEIKAAIEAEKAAAIQHNLWN